MSARHPEAGFSLIEMLVSFAILLLLLTSIATFVVRNSQANTAEQMTVSIQADVRNSLTLVENILRTAGWDPRNIGIATVSLDPSPTGPDNYIEVFADLNEDGDTLDQDEDITIRHHNNRLEWRRTYDTSQPFETLADDITNDQDGDGTIEPMFTPDSATNPSKIIVKITAQAASTDPRSGQFIRYTSSSEVVLRANL